MADERPKYFADRPGAEGLRYYWQATAPLKRRLEHLRAPFRALVRLPDDEAAAKAECRAITARVEAWLAAEPAAVESAVEALRRTHGTIAHAIADYRLSKPYRERIEPATKKQYDWMLGLVEEWAGDMRVADLTYKEVMAAADRLADKPRSQQLFLTLLAMLVDRHAQKNAAPGELVANPVRLVLKDVDKPEPKGGWIWPRGAVVHFARAAEALGRASIGTAVLLNHWLAQRTGDLLALPRAAYREGVLHIVQSKTKQYVPIPVDDVAELRDRIAWQFEQERALAGTNVALWKPATLLICETTRQPWQIDHFRHEFARIRAVAAGANDAAPDDLAKLAAAAISPAPCFELDAVPRRIWAEMAGGEEVTTTVATADLRFSHLRHTGITRYAQAGCTDEEVQAVSGHKGGRKTSTMHKHYLAITEERARAALAKRMAFEAGLGSKADTKSAKAAQ